TRARDRVDAVHIVDVAVAIIIKSIGGFVVTVGIETGLSGIGPEVVPQILVRQADAGIDDRHDHIGSGSPQAPAVRSVDVGSGLPTIYAGVLKIPLRAVVEPKI